MTPEALRAFRREIEKRAGVLDAVKTWGKKVMGGPHVREMTGEAEQRLSRAGRWRDAAFDSRNHVGKMEDDARAEWYVLRRHFPPGAPEILSAAARMRRLEVMARSADGAIADASRLRGSARSARDSVLDSADMDVLKARLQAAAGVGGAAAVGLGARSLLRKDEPVEKTAGPVNWARHAWHGVVGGPALQGLETSALERLGALGRSPLKTLGEGWKELPRWAQALNAGVGGYDLGMAATAPEERSKRLGNVLGGSVGSVAMGGRVPLLGQLAGYEVMRRLGGGVGGLFDKKKV